MNRKVKSMLTFISRLSFDTHLWCISVIGGAILLCISFFVGMGNKQLSYNAKVNGVGNTAERTIEYSSVLGNISVNPQYVKAELQADESVEADNIVDEAFINDIEGMNDVTELTEFIPEVIEAQTVIELAVEESTAGQDIDVVVQDDFIDEIIAEPVIVPEDAGEFDSVNVIENNDNNVDMNSQYTLEEIEMLNKLVQCEAQTEDLEGRRLIANVVLNRVKSGIWGNTIEDVIKSPGQFHPVKRGGLNVAVVDDVTREAVMQALNGIDESSGALYFQKSKSKVWGKKTYLFRYGAHSFYL